MNKKTILSKTVLFIFIILFITTFIKIFGEENTLIAVTTVTGALMFLENDLTLNAARNALVLIGFNVFLGIMSYLATSNMYLGVLINFAVMFIIGFTLCHNLKSPTYLPFSLQYIFMLSSPISLEKLPNRIGSLIFGALVIMGAQLIINRDKVSKAGDKLLTSICVNLNEKIRLLERKENTEVIDSRIKDEISKFRKVIYDKREREFYLPEESRIKLDILVALSRINLILNEVKNSEKIDILEKKVIPLIENIKVCLEDKKNLENLDSLFNEIIIEEEITDYISLKIINIIELIEDDLYSLIKLEKKDYNLVKRRGEIPESYKRAWRCRREISRDSLRFTYGFRLGIGIAFSAFIVEFLGLVDGRWIYFTVNSINQPQYEMSKKKSLDRILGTFIGVIIITILFSVFKDTSIRGIIIMATGYVSSYLVQYKYKMICTTVSAVGAASLIGNVGELGGVRILYVIIGVIIAMLINKFIFPFSIKDSTINLINTYNHIVEKMIKNVSDYINEVTMDEEMKNLILYSGLIEERLTSINSSDNYDKLSRYLTEQHLLVMNIYDLYIWIRKDEISKDKVLKSIEYIKNNKEIFTEEKMLSIQNEIGNSSFNKDKLLFISTIEVLDGFSKIRNIDIKI